MREAIGGTWLLGLVLTFIVFFASFLAVSINYAKAFNVKNAIVDYISKYEGNNKKSRQAINNYLQDTGYLVPGNCKSIGDAYTYQGYDLNGRTTGDSYYCISSDSVDSSSGQTKKFYRVVIFFKIDLPVVGDIAIFKIKGETESLYFFKDEIN